MEAPAARVVTADELALIKTTVAVGATDAELKLFLFDCARQGVHPLDRLLHFTKRGGKYTPITSIDFMRIRAADSGEMAGSDDPVFYNFNADAEPISYPAQATVTVYRLTQGQRFAYTATARWSEYKPEQNDFMWRKMPHTMLGKCAEALALRKGFPRQLAGLYAKEELDQADQETSDGNLPRQSRQPTADHAPRVGEVIGRSSEKGERESHQDVRSREHGDHDGGARRHSGLDDGPDLGVDLPPGALLVTNVEITATQNANVKKALINFSDGKVRSTVNTALMNSAEQCRAERIPVWVTDKVTRWGIDLVKLSQVAEL